MNSVARAASVSQATVSLALRNNTCVSPATRARVLAEASRLGYRPNANFSTLLARIRLRRPVQYRATLGALTFWPNRRTWRTENFAWRRFFDGARTRAHDLGFVLEEFWLPLPGLTLKRLQSIFDTRRIEGVVIFPASTPIQLPLDWHRLAACEIGFMLKHPRLHRVAHDHYDAVRSAIKELRQRGYRQIGLVVDNIIGEKVQRKWLASFLVHQPGSETSDRSAVLLASPHNDTAFGKWIRHYRPDAIIVGGPLPVVDWLRSAGWRVPEDVAVAGLSNFHEVAGYSGVSEKNDLVGASAVDSVVAQLQRNERGVPPHPKEIYIKGCWRIGPTVPPLAHREAVTNLSKTTAETAIS